MCLSKCTSLYCFKYWTLKIPTGLMLWDNLLVCFLIGFLYKGVSEKESLLGFLPQGSLIFDYPAPNDLWVPGSTSR
jgi:hypothetical protein